MILEDFFRLEPLLPQLEKAIATFERVASDPAVSAAISTITKYLSDPDVKEAIATAKQAATILNTPQPSPFTPVTDR